MTDFFEISYILCLQAYNTSIVNGRIVGYVNSL